LNGGECEKKNDYYVVFGGGGGEGRSGIPNALVISRFHHGSNYLSDQPAIQVKY
nr:quinoprotein alcohol dehydrogenase-like superfamily [Tanacetum cinerariifolium]